MIALFQVNSDFTDDTAPKKVVDATLAAFGQIDVLVNNAGQMKLSPGKCVLP